MAKAKTFNFRLGKDPLGSSCVEDVFDRLLTLSDEYPDHVQNGDDFHPAKVHVWAVSIDAEGDSYFAPAKVLGYAKNVAAYLRYREASKAMTGVDAVTALRKRGFIDCDPTDFPEIQTDLEEWLTTMGSAPRSVFRFLIHRSDIGRMSAAIQRIGRASSKLKPVEKRALLELLEAGEIQKILIQDC